MVSEKIKTGDETAEAKREAILVMLQGKALTKISRAQTFFVPNLWLRLYGWEVDGRTWVKVNVEVDKITISPIDREEALSMMEVNDVKPDTSQVRVS